MRRPATRPSLISPGDPSPIVVRDHAVLALALQETHPFAAGREQLLLRVLVEVDRQEVVQDVERLVGHLHRPRLLRGVGRRPEDQDASPLAFPVGPLRAAPVKRRDDQLRRPSPSTSAHRMRCSVGSSAIECSSHGAPAAPCLTQCSVPPPVVFVGCQLAPSATSSFPSRSMSCSARHDVVFRRRPAQDDLLLKPRSLEPDEIRAR